MALKWDEICTSRQTANVGEILWLEVTPREAREDWEWRAFDSKADLIAGGARGGRGPEPAKSAAEAFAREWIAAQAAALGRGAAA